MDWGAFFTGLALGLFFAPILWFILLGLTIPRIYKRLTHETLSSPAKPRPKGRVRVESGRDSSGA